ncbi:hypothetical protein [Streptomyces albus]|nr:hypothetical protein [Streptomyces albus]
MSLRDQWERRRIGSRLVVVVAATALLLMILFVVLMLAGYGAPPQEGAP